MNKELSTKELVGILYERHPEIFDRKERHWVSLTEGEIIDADLYTMRTRGDSYAFARAVEAKLKEKNGV